MSNAFDKASLVMLPHAYEEGKLYSLKPTDRSGDFTFSRGTDTATRVNEQGYIEKEIVNLLEQSNSFDTTWISSGLTLTSGQAGYDGTNDAWLFDKNNAGASEFIRVDNSVSGVSTASFYSKSNTLDWAFILIFDGAAQRRAWFNVSTGELGTLSNVIDASIQSAGNGYYRCSVSVSGCTQLRIYAGVTDGIATGSLGSIYIQDAQINYGLVAQPYLETTTAPVYGGLTDNMPRLDYTDASCPSLLLEPSRTNLVTYSEYGYASNNTSLYYNNETSPEGVQNALKVTATATSSAFIRTGAITTTAASTFSAFVKYENNEWLHFINSGSGTAFFNFNCQTGEFGTSGSSTSNLNAEDYGNGWWRVSGTFGFIGAGSLRIYLASSSNTSFGGASTTIGNYFYSYGWQYEEGSYPTSYIPTYGSTQTRDEDDCSDSNVIDADNDFTFYFESTLIEGSGDKYFQTSVFGYLSGYKVVNQNLRQRYNSTNYTSNAPEGVFKYLVRKDSTNMKIYLNGVLEHTITTLPTGTSDLEKLGGKVHKILLFPEALSDAECIALTTL